MPERSHDLYPVAASAALILLGCFLAVAQAVTETQQSAGSRLLAAVAIVCVFGWLSERVSFSMGETSSRVRRAQARRLRWDYQVVWA